MRNRLWVIVACLMTTAAEAKPLASYTLTPILKTVDGGSRWELSLNGRTFPNEAALLQYLSDFPAGTEVAWSPGCDVEKGMPLQTAEALASFERELKARHLVLKHVPSG